MTATSYASIIALRAGAIMVREIAGAQFTVAPPNQNSATRAKNLKEVENDLCMAVQLAYCDKSNQNSTETLLPE